MKLFVTIYNDAKLASHFLRHYSQSGVSGFYIAVSDELKVEVERVAKGYPVTVVPGLDTLDSVLAGTAAVSEMRRRYQRPDEWIVIVDLDEFVECRDLPSVVAEGDKAGATVVRGTMYDRFSADGLPKDFSPDSDLSETYPVKARFTRNVMDGCDYKGVLVKGHLWSKGLSAHHRFVGERLFTRELEISHYKWTAGVIERMRKAQHLVEKAGQTWAVQYHRALEHFDAHRRFAWETFGGVLKKDFVPDPPAGYCAVCGCAIAEVERDYSMNHFGRSLCRFDQTGGAISASSPQ